MKFNSKFVEKNQVPLNSKKNIGYFIKGIIADITTHLHSFLMQERFKANFVLKYNTAHALCMMDEKSTNTFLIFRNYCFSEQQLLRDRASYQVIRTCFPSCSLIRDMNQSSIPVNSRYNFLSTTTGSKRPGTKRPVC
jgi:hypothetical protein